MVNKVLNSNLRPSPPQAVILPGCFLSHFQQLGVQDGELLPDKQPTCWWISEPKGCHGSPSPLEDAVGFKSLVGSNFQTEGGRGRIDTCSGLFTNSLQICNNPEQVTAVLLSCLGKERAVIPPQRNRAGMGGGGA